MHSADDLCHKKRIAKVAYKLNIPEEVINLALTYTSEYIKEKISKVNLDPDVLISEEEFNERFPIINIPSLGWLKPNYMAYKKIHNKSITKRRNAKQE
jgi:hypothetical protein